MRKFVWIGLIIVTLLAGCGNSAETNPPTPQSQPTRLPTLAPPLPTKRPSPENIWEERVFYEIFVRSFYDSDGDGVGDIQGIIERLDYLNDGNPSTTDDLGVTGLWLMPVMESPSYHGYDVVDYYAIDQEYGTREDFEQLLAAAHERGMVVIVDMVLNHTSSQHAWFETAASDPDSAERDYYVWADDPAGSGWHTIDGGTYFGIFWDQMPDLNFRNPAVTAEIHNISRFWLEEMGVDGFRLDAIKHLVEDGSTYENTPETRQWMAEYNAFLKTINPQFMTVGEVWSNTYESSQYVEDGGVDLTFDFEIAKGIISSARGNRRNAQSTIHTALEQYPNQQFATFITNHDQNRAINQLVNDPARAKVAATLLLTSPGVPFVYYGEEIGMTGQKPDEKIRTPMQWSAELNAGFTTATPWIELTAEWPERNVATLAARPDSLLSHYRALIHLRNQYPALNSGDWAVVESNENKVYAHLRTTEDHAALIIINIGKDPITNFTLSLDESNLQADWAASTILGSDAAPIAIDNFGGFSDYQPFSELAPFSSHIIDLR